MSSTAPAAPPGFNVITEGQASVLVPKGNKVFYNNVQEFNRDLSICVLSNYGAIRKAEFEEKAQKWLSGADERAKKRTKKEGESEQTSAAPLTTDDVPDRLKYKGLRIFEVRRRVVCHRSHHEHVISHSPNISQYMFTHTPLGTVRFWSSFHPLFQRNPQC